MVSDLGGTLLTPEHLVGDLTIDTLRVLEQKGVDIILATGRNHTEYVIHSWKNRCGTCGYDYIKRCSCTGFTG
ncbi:TPA: HAD hydrolase family protein [Neisseria gonorrhoeae]